MTHRTRPHGDDGSALLMAMVFVFVVGLVILGLLAQTGTNLKASRVVQETTDKDYAVDAGLEQAIETLRLHPTVCANPGPAEALPSVNVNDHAVDTTCQTVLGAASGASGWAVVITGTSENSFDVGGGNELKRIEGPMYVANLGSSYNKPWRVENGDLYERQSASGCNLADTTPPSGVDVGPDPPFSYQCTTDGVPSIDHDLPASAPGTAPATTTSGPCTIFSPGTYDATRAAALNAPGDKYFKSGTYYFHGIGNWTVDGTVIGGKAAATESREVDPDDCDGQTDAEPGTGVKFIFGGSSRMTVNATGSHQSSVELFRRTAGAASEGEMGFSFQAVETTANGFTASNTGGAAILALSGNVADFIAHGTIYAPLSLVDTQINKTQANIQGGIVAQRLVLGSSANISGLAIASAEAPEVRKIVVRATAQGKGSSRDLIGTVVLLLDNNSDRTFEVESWRVE